jgi:hypothetical protein
MAVQPLSIGGRTLSMVTKERRFGPLPMEASLKDLVPDDNFYRRSEAALALSIVRDLVSSPYANSGRASVDPSYSSSCN